MSAQITCPSCQTKLNLPSDIGPDSKVKCPKCGKVLGIPKKKIPSPADSQPALAVEERPPLSRSLPATPILAFALPTGAILAALLSLAMPILIGQYLLGLIIAFLAALGSVIGLVLLLLKGWKGTAIHLAGAAICATAIFVCINALMLQGSVEKNGELLAKNERAVTQAKADLDESKKKLAEAEDAPRKAEEILKKAEEAPKKAEAFFKMTKDTQDKIDAAEKRTADLLAKVEELEKKNDSDRKKITDDQAKVDLSEKNLKALQKNLDQTQKDIEDKRQEMVTLKKEIESDKKTASDELSALKKEIAADKKKVEEKQKETKDFLKKVEEALKKMVLNLKSKDPEMRLRTAKELAKLPASPELKAITAEALVESMLDPAFGVKDAAEDAVKRIDPLVHPHILGLLVNQQDAATALQAIEKLGEEAKSALPAVIYCHNNGLGSRIDYMDPCRLLVTMAKIAPSDKRVGQIILNEIARPKPFGRERAIKVLDTVKVDQKDRIKALLIALNDGAAAVLVIEAIEKTEPAATEAIQILKKLSLSSADRDVRKAATKALAAIEAQK